MKILKNKYFWTVSLAIALVIIFLALMPKPIDMSLEKIGDGQESVVFVYDPNLSVSNQQAIEINKAREVIGEKVTFLIAKEGDPNSESFRKRYRARSAELLFFNSNGELIDRKVALVSAEEFIGIMSGR